MATGFQKMREINALKPIIAKKDKPGSLKKFTFLNQIMRYEIPHDYVFYSTGASKCLYYPLIDFLWKSTPTLEALNFSKLDRLMTL